MFFSLGTPILTIVLIILATMLNHDPEHKPTWPNDSISEIYTPHAEIEIATTSNCAEVISVSSSEYGALHMLLLNSEFELNHGAMLQMIATIGNNWFGKTIELSGKNASATFCRLQSNFTYYLYYFEESYNTQFREKIKCKVFQTEPEETISMMLARYSHCVAWALVSILASGCLPLLFKKLKQKIEAKRNEKAIIALVQENKIEQENIILEKSNREFEDRRICGLCCDRHRDVIFLDCGHIYSCSKCAKFLHKCPLDNKPIKKMFRFRMCDKYGISEDIMSELVDKSKENVCQDAGLAGDQLLARKQHDALQELNFNYDYFNKCIICNQRRKDILFEDCCHLVCCAECSKTVQKCPIDQIVITQKYQGFFA